MTKLPAYNQNAKCKMCGGKDIANQYANNSGYDCSFKFKCPYDVEKTDHIHRTCRNCGYLWIEGIVNRTSEPKPTGKK